MLPLDKDFLVPYYPYVFITSSALELPTACLLLSSPYYQTIVNATFYESKIFSFSHILMPP